MCSTLSPLSGCQDVSISAAGLLTLLTPEPVVNILPGGSILKRNPNIFLSLGRPHVLSPLGQNWRTKKVFA